jgi:transposase-like protein
MTIKKFSGKGVCPYCKSTNVRMVRKGSKGNRIMQCADCEEMFEFQKLKPSGRRDGEHESDALAWQDDH